MKNEYDPYVLFAYTHQRGVKLKKGYTRKLITCAMSLNEAQAKIKDWLELNGYDTNNVESFTAIHHE